MLPYQLRSEARKYRNVTARTRAREIQLVERARNPLPRVITETEVRAAERARRARAGFSARGLARATIARNTMRVVRSLRPGLAGPVFGMMDLMGGRDPYQGGWEGFYPAKPWEPLPFPGQQVPGPDYNYVGQSVMQPGLKPSYEDTTSGQPAGSSSTAAAIALGQLPAPGAQTASGATAGKFTPPPRRRPKRLTHLQWGWARLPR